MEIGSKENLKLPELSFVAVDQWIEEIGDKAFIAWLKMYTMTDRDKSKGDKPGDVNLWEVSKIPYSLSKVRKKLGVGNDTFSNKILKPLWEVGLIDLEEYGESKQTGTKPRNIIVYKFPFNNKDLACKEISRRRSYEKDYNSEQKIIGKMGGRPSKEGQYFYDSQQGTPPVPKENTPAPVSEHPSFQKRTPRGSETEHNNTYNLSTNNLNDYNKSLIDINKPNKIDKNQSVTLITKNKEMNNQEKEDALNQRKTMIEEIDESFNDLFIEYEGDYQTKKILKNMYKNKQTLVKKGIDPEDVIAYYKSTNCMIMSHEELITSLNHIYDSPNKIHSIVNYLNTCAINAEERAILAQKAWG